MYLFPRKCESDNRLDGKTVIITGSNSGLGKEVTKMLYQRGAKILMACRNEDTAIQVKKEIEILYENNENIENLGKLQTVKLDLASLVSIRKCAEEILNTEPRLDILINNAGFTGKKEKTIDGFEKTFGVNYLGHLYFTLLLLPLLKKTKPSRILNIASCFYIFGRLNLNDLNYERTMYMTLEAYGRSKLAIILISKHLAKLLKERGINDVNVYSLHPGIGKTAIGRNLNGVFPGLSFIWSSLTRMCMSVENCCQTILYCAIDDKCNKESGLYYSNCEATTPYSKATNEEQAKILWKISCELLGYNSSDPF